jgi:hypothetical protein
VPRFTAVPSSIDSEARIVPSAMSSTYVQLRICSPLPHTSKGSRFRNPRAIIAITAWFSTPRGPYTVKYRHEAVFIPCSSCIAFKVSSAAIFAMP